MLRGQSIPPFNTDRSKLLFDSVPLPVTERIPVTRTWSSVVRILTPETEGRRSWKCLGGGVSEGQTEEEVNPLSSVVLVLSPRVPRWTIRSEELRRAGQTLLHV